MACLQTATASGPDTCATAAVGNTAKTRLQIPVALSDVKDLPMRLAASSTLATLTVSLHICQSLSKLEMERHWLLIGRAYIVRDHSGVPGRVPRR